MGTSRKSTLLVVENLPVPYDRRVWQEALTLKAAGFDVSVLGPATKSHPKLRETLEGINIYRYPMLVEGRTRFGLVQEYVWSFICIFLCSLYISTRRQFSIVHFANPPDIFFPVLRFWRFFGKKIVFDHHDLTPELFMTKFRTTRSPVLRLFYFAERRTLRVAHKVISTNESYRDVAIRRGGRSADDVVVVRNAPDPARFNILPPKNEWKRSCRHLVAFLGEIGEQDGVDILVRAMKAIRNRLGRGMAHCVIMGGGPFHDAIVHYAEAEGVSDLITFTGRADNQTISEVLSTADIGVDPCPYSVHSDISTATKIMEYMFFSLPIVAFDLTETRRSGGDDVALYARRNDELDFAEKIMHLIDQGEERYRRGKLGRERLNTVLAWSSSAKSLVTLMNSLV